MKKMEEKMDKYVRDSTRKIDLLEMRITSLEEKH